MFMIALTGGKTGGHVTPLLSVCEQLTEDVLYVGNENSLEERCCQKENIPFFPIHFPKMNLFRAVWESFRLFQKLPQKPKAIFSTGGFVSVPLLLYGIFHHVPIYLLEENVVMGNSNRFFSFWAEKVFLSYPVSKMKKKYQVVGQPLRKIEYSYGKYASFAMDILVLGGSLGSLPLCDLAVQLSDRWKVGLIAGRYFEKFKNNPNLYVFEYVPDLPNLMLQARWIISRAGAATSSEIFFLRKPCILIPSLHTKKNHQYQNALYFQKKQAAILLSEGVKAEEVTDTILRYQADEAMMVNMKEAQKKLTGNFAARIIAEILEGKQ